MTLIPRKMKSTSEPYDSSIPLEHVGLKKYRQLVFGTLEWLSEHALVELRAQENGVIHVAPRTWGNGVEELTAMFSPPNYLTNLCREIATMGQGDKKNLGEAVDQYAFCITRVSARLLSESKRTVPPTKSPEFFTWERQKIAVFENGFLPAIRNKQVREDLVRTFAAIKDRACKSYASNKIRGVSTTHLSSVVTVPTPILENQLETYSDEVQATVASPLVDGLKYQKRGRSKTKRQGTSGRPEKYSSSSRCYTCRTNSGYGNCCGLREGSAPILAACLANRQPSAL